MYTGVSYVVPEDGYYCINFKALYQHSRPQFIGVTNRSGTYDELASSAVGYNHATCTLVGYLTRGTALNVWAKYGSADTNLMAIGGFYVKQL